MAASKIAITIDDNLLKQLDLNDLFIHFDHSRLFHFFHKLGSLKLCLTLCIWNA